MKQEKKCENCKFYIQHYIKKAHSFQKLFRGHCSNWDTPLKIRKHDVYFDSCCDKWEQREDLKTDNRESIKTVIRDIRKSLAEIAFILKDD